MNKDISQGIDGRVSNIGQRDNQRLRELRGLDTPIDPKTTFGYNGANISFEDELRLYHPVDPAEYAPLTKHNGKVNKQD